MIINPDGTPAVCGICSQVLEPPVHILTCSHTFHEDCWRNYARAHVGVDAGCPSCDYKVRPATSTFEMVDVVGSFPGAQSLPVQPKAPLLGKRARSRADELASELGRMGLEK
jgi:Zinc finger, C3HC4 type (RING finger)